MEPKMEVWEKCSSSLWLLFVHYITAIDASLAEVERHLEMGKQFLAKGQFADALTHYHAAVDLDPDNYQTLYRRATVYLATGRSKAAIPDLDRVITLKPDFSSARMQRGNVLLKQGDLEAASKDFQSVLAEEPDNSKAKEALESIAPTAEAINFADSFLDQGDLQSAEMYLTKALDVCPWDSQLRERRADLYERLDMIPKAIADIRATTKLAQDSTEAFVRLSFLYYLQGDADESLNQVRECLKLNPDHKIAFAHYKKVKKLVKQQTQLREMLEREEWEECIEKVGAILKTEPENAEIHHQADVSLCRCHMKAGASAKAIGVCSEVLEVEPDNVNVLCDRADAYVDSDQLDDALRDFKRALELSEELRRAREGVQRVEKLIKQAGKRDYYKILGVRRNANKREIMKAYRKLAQKWHPDNFRDETEKKAAEKKFIDIAAAKEVLSDPEMREKYNNGEDPLDPEAQQHAHNPFQQGFNPFGGGGGFGGGGFQFKFHF